jgi:hypothetical protein
MRWQDLPIVGGSYRDDTRPWSVQDTVNFIPVQAEKQGTRSPALLRGAPGLDAISLTGDAGTPSGPCRGLHNAEGTLFGVYGNALWEIGTTGKCINRGNVPGVERVSMAHNQVAGGNQLAIAANGAGYVWDTSNSTFQQITDDGFPGAMAFTFIDGYLFAADPSGNFVFNSSLADALTYNTLDRAQAEAQPDKIVGIIATHEQLWVFGERTVQPFSKRDLTSDNPYQPFAADGNMSMEVGCASGRTICQMDNSVFWLGNDNIVYRADGYTPQRVSTHAIEQAIARANAAQAFAFTHEDRGHKVYYLTLPDGETWGFDAASGEWHRRQSYGLKRWRLNDLVKWGQRWVGGDYAIGKLYALNWSTQAEGSAPLERRRVLGVVADSQNPIIVNGLEVVADTGEQASVTTNMDVRYSRDGGRNWSDWRKLSMGATGDFVQRLQMRRFGRGRQWVFDVRITDPVRADIMAASWMPEQCDD